MDRRGSRTLAAAGRGPGSHDAVLGRVDELKGYHDLAFYPDALYVLVSLGEDEADPVTGQPSVRAWRILEGAVHEVGLRVEG